LLVIVVAIGRPHGNTRLKYGITSQVVQSPRWLIAS
jgi:hypothetical protein